MPTNRCVIVAGVQGGVLQHCSSVECMEEARQRRQRVVRVDMLVSVCYVGNEP